jgi:hypothetical protein
MSPIKFAVFFLLCVVTSAHLSLSLLPRQKAPIFKAKAVIDDSFIGIYIYLLTSNNYYLFYLYMLLTIHIYIYKNIN